MRIVPWTLDDYPDSMKNLSKVTKKKAIDIANALIEDGYKDQQAIPIAINQAKEWYDKTSEDEREDYLQHGKVTVHDQKHKSNPALLDENELVLPHDGKWAVQSKKAKRISKQFDKKADAIEYAKKVAKNKQTALEIYKQDGSLERKYSYRDEK